MILKSGGEPRLGKPNGSAGKFKSAEGEGYYAKQVILRPVSQLPETKNTRRGPDCFLKSSTRRRDGFGYFDC